MIINLSGQDIIITSDDFSVDSTGKIFARSGTIGGFDMTANSFSSDIYSEYDFTEEDLTKIKNYIMGKVSLTEQELETYDVYKDGIIDARDYMMIKSYTATGISKSSPGKVELTNGDVFNTFTIKDGNGNDLVNINALESYIKSLQVDSLNVGGKDIVGITYSTTEQKIGVWHNGKPLYQKTIIINGNGTESIYHPIDVENIDFAKINYGDSYCQYSDTNSFPICRTRDTDELETTISDGWINIVNIAGKDYTGWTFVIIIEYTKTTD